MIVLATDSFFMAMFFFLSGLFVWPGLARKGPLDYLRDRLIRLGLPFVICAFTIIPLTYYAIELRQHPDVSFADFWWKTITEGPWPSGPIWFLWVLVAFDVVACILYKLSPNLLDPINRLSLRGHGLPAQFFAVLLAVTAAFYIPGRVYFGPARWFEFGPLLGPARSRAALCDLLLFRCGLGGCEFRSRIVERRRPVGKEQLGLGDLSAGSVFRHVGADLHQARNTGKSGPAARLV